jgi:hypothetical protein
VLKDLPEDWDQRLWLAVGDDWRYREALAVHLTVPVRPEELVAGRRPAGWSAGVVVDLHWPNRLEITFAPVKSHGGLYGTELTTIVIDPTIADEPAKFLAERCRASGDRLVVSIKSKNAVRKAIGALGRKALPGIDIVITPYVMRNQLIADFKATFGGGEIVAAAGGHGTDRTQAGYGHFAHGRARKGYLGISAARPPRAENVERARQLSRGKRLRQKKP